MLADQSKVWTVPDYTKSGGIAFAFANWDACSLLTTHAMTCIAVNQILFSALHFGGLPAERLRGRLYELSERIWMSLAYVQGESPAARSELIGPLIMTFEYLNVAERDMYAKKMAWLLGRKSYLSGSLSRANSPHNLQAAHWTTG